MKRTFRIILDDSLLPVQAFFNIIADEDFLSILEAFSNGIGAGYNDSDCDFHQEGSVKYIEFSLMDEEVNISNSEFIKYLEMASKSFIEDNMGNNELKEKTLNLLSIIKSNLLS